MLFVGGCYWLVPVCGLLLVCCFVFRGVVGLFACFVGFGLLVD